MGWYFINFEHVSNLNIGNPILTGVPTRYWEGAKEIGAQT